MQWEPGSSCSTYTGNSLRMLNQLALASAECCVADSAARPRRSVGENGVGLAFDSVVVDTVPPWPSTAEVRRPERRTCCGLRLVGLRSDSERRSACAMRSAVAGSTAWVGVSLLARKARSDGTLLLRACWYENTPT